MSPFTLNQYLCSDHPRTQLFEDEYVAIAAATNTLIGDTLSAEQYFSLGHVAVRFADAQNPAFEEWFVRAALKPRRVEVVTPLFGNVPLFLVGTNRLATVHRRLAEHLPNSTRSAFCPSRSTSPASGRWRGRGARPDRRGRLFQHGSSMPLTAAVMAIGTGLGGTLLFVATSLPALCRRGGEPAPS